MASNDSVSEHRFVSQLSPDDIAVIIIIITIIIVVIIIYLHTRMHKAVSFYNNFLQDRVISSQPRVIPYLWVLGSYFIFLYSLTTFAWLALTGVQDSRRHSCRGHGDVQTASTL